MSDQTQLFEVGEAEILKSVLVLAKPEEIDLVDEDGNLYALADGDVITVEYQVIVDGLGFKTKRDEQGHGIGDRSRRHETRVKAGSARVTALKPKAELDAEWEAQRPESKQLASV